jgi:archaemetzincin
MERLREGLVEAFGRDITLMEEMPLPAHCEDKGRGQWHSTKMLEGIPRAKGMALGVTEVDLYVPGLNFVFGEADPGRGVCLISLARLREEFWGRASNEELFVGRAVKEAVHESGHLLGLPHCPDPKCVMHFSNSLLDTDVKGRGFCERCGRAMRSQ